jgi:hypothetical protein
MTLLNDILQVAIVVTAVAVAFAAMAGILGRR